jgi:hypothetical protein
MSIQQLPFQTRRHVFYLVRTTHSVGVTLVFFALLFVACLKYRLISAQVSGGLELDCFPITRSKSTSSWRSKTQSCP